MSPPGVNLLLNSLSAASRDRLLGLSKSVDLPVRTTLYEPEVPPRYAHFLTSGIASIVTTTTEGMTAEVGIVGAEGVAGGLHLLGPGVVPTHCFMQLAGTGYRIPLADLHEAFLDSAEIRARILEFVQEQALSLSQLAACHRLHDAEERLSRWLLMVKDRVNSDVIDLTQEFLAEMLGSRRTTVTLAAGVLQRSGLIEYTRGRVRILDRDKLEQAACDCYQVVKALHHKLYLVPNSNDGMRDGHASRSVPRV